MAKGSYSFLIFPDYSGLLISVSLDSIDMKHFPTLWERIWRVVEPIEKLFGGDHNDILSRRALTTCGYGNSACGLRIIVPREVIAEITKVNDTNDEKLIPALSDYLKRHARELSDIVDYCEKKMGEDA
jgi:hypothetical protein